MAGSVRKIMAYLGLVDDEYDDYEELSERSRPMSARPPRSARPDPRDRGYDDDVDDRYDRAPRAGRTNDRYDRYDRDPQMGTVSRIRPVASDGGPAGGSSRPVAPNRPAVVPMAADGSKVHVVAPTTFGDAKEIGDQIRQANPVIVNLQQADRDLQRRMIDFCSGIAYALECSMERVADQVFLLMPTDIPPPAEERARLQARGFNRG